MKAACFFSMSLWFILFAWSCVGDKQEKGNGNIISQKHEIEYFERIEVEGNFVVNLRKSNRPELEIITDENLHELIEIDQRRRLLRISTGKKLKSEHDVQINLGFTNLQEIKSSGSNVIHGQDTLIGDFLQVESKGSGDINLAVELKVLKVLISGAGSVDLKGSVMAQNVVMSGAGNLKAFGLTSQECKIQMSGVGGATLHVKKRLEAKVSGIGGIRYIGNPAEVISDISGLGSITKADAERKKGTE